MDEERNIAEEEQRGLTFKDILYILRKHWIAIVAFIIVGTAGGFVWSRVEKPVYKSSASMLVSYESKNQSVQTDYTFSNYISSTYVSVIKENLVMDKVAEKTGISSGTLKANTSVSAQSLLISVSYTDSDKERAKEVVQVIIDTAQEVANTTEIVNGEEKPVYHLLYDNLKVFSAAKDAVKVSHTLRDLAIGLGAGAVLAFAYVVIRELSDNTFKSSEEIERMLNIPVLAGIPDYHFDDEKKGGK